MMWYLTRSSGIVATVLMLAAVADGLLFSGREGGKRLRPAWWLDLHKGLGGYALIFTLIHLVTAYADSDLGVRLIDILVPGVAAEQTSAYTWGVLAFYGMAITVLSSWPRKRLGRRSWHLVHLLSIPATALACVHAYQLGSDAREPFFILFLTLFVGAVMYPLGLRLSGIANRRREGPSQPAGLADGLQEASSAVAEMV